MTPEQIPSKKSVRKAGEALRQQHGSIEEFESAHAVLSAWRGSFYSSIDTLLKLVRKKGRDLKLKNPIFARRLKRAPSIIAKLKRFPDMQLERMQDIGGIRAIVQDVKEVYQLHDSIVYRSRHRHESLLPPKDYIKQPKPDGYRGIHQVFKVRTRPAGEPLERLIELQIRTKLQHYWATAVETLGSIEKSSFKIGEGEEKFKYFFILSSALMSIKEEQPIVESLAHKTHREIAEEFLRVEKELGVFKKLTLFTKSLQKGGFKTAKKSAYFLLLFNASSMTLNVLPFGKDQASFAEDSYRLYEASQNFDDVVLVSIDDVKSLVKAYPNYFADTQLFIKNLTEICDEILSSEAL